MIAMWSMALFGAKYDSLKNRGLPTIHAMGIYRAHNLKVGYKKRIRKNRLYERSYQIWIRENFNIHRKTNKNTLGPIKFGTAIV
jgi:hypothetical protein